MLNAGNQKRTEKHSPQTLVEVYSTSGKKFVNILIYYCCFGGSQPVSELYWRAIIHYNGWFRETIMIPVFILWMLKIQFHYLLIKPIDIQRFLNTGYKLHLFYDINYIYVHIISLYINVWVMDTFYTYIKILIMVFIGRCIMSAFLFLTFFICQF